MNEVVKVGNTELQIKEYKGRRVVTFKDIDECHERPDGTARKRFSDNKKRFIEGVDYFKITPSEFRTAFGDMDKRQQNNVSLITESGYLMLVKSFTDDLAWKVQRMLVDTYFRKTEVLKLPMTYKEALIDLVKQVEVNEQLQLENKELKPKAEYYDCILQSKDLITTTQIAKDYGWSAQQFNNLLHELGIQYKQSGQWVLYSKYQDEGYTNSATAKFKHKDDSEGSRLYTKWTQKGRLFLYDYLKENDIVPLIEKESQKELMFG